MARKSYRSRASNGYRRASFRKSKGGFGVNISPAFMAGVAIGYTNMDKQLPAQLVLGAAAAPVKGLGVVKAGAQGVIIGNMIQGMTGGNAITGSQARSW